MGLNDMLSWWTLVWLVVLSGVLVALTQCAVAEVFVRLAARMYSSSPDVRAAKLEEWLRILEDMKPRERPAHAGSLLWAAVRQLPSHSGLVYRWQFASLVAADTTVAPFRVRHENHRLNPDLVVVEVTVPDGGLRAIEGLRPRLRFESLRLRWFLRPPGVFFETTTSQATDATGAIKSLSRTTRFWFSSRELRTRRRGTRRRSRVARDPRASADPEER